MPDYLIDAVGQRVEVRITGRILDERYTRVLMQQTDLSLAEVVLLDKVQKGQSLAPGEIRTLKRRKLIEGRTPNLHISQQMAEVLGEQAKYLRDKGFQKDFYVMWVLKRLKMGACKRADLEAVLLEQLPKLLSDLQKRNKVKNLLAEMSREQFITADGKRGPGAMWRLLPAGLDKLGDEAGA